MKLSEARQLLEAGHSCQQIAKLAGLSANDIREALGINAAYVKELVEVGHNLPSIIYLTGSSDKWVINRFKELNIKPPDQRRKINDDSAMRLYRMGKNDHQIALTLDVSPSAICLWRKKNNLPALNKRGTN